jgi:ABC-2 type transport system ATP-binding protein/lipopolysaccharide transport system ATP-binding protein
MNAPAIEFRDVSLRYRLLSERGIVTLKEWMIRRMTSRIAYQELCALSAVSFTVQPGRTFGIIGHNGAGKSTLLRIAGGILAPTAGEAVVRGRLAPIIELGLGFEGELSGRENIFFNGALLGRSWTEMNSRLDDIVDFSELGEFIDQPIRTYSSGMVARLAFAIATTVDAHILLLDEVMSVGDEHFRQKCQRRISEFREAGVTILVVSHDLDAVKRLCDEVMWLEQGVVREIGPAADVVDSYGHSMGASTGDASVGGMVRTTES